MSAIALSNLTHQPGTPWDCVYIDGVYNIEIPDSVIEKHYKEKLSVATESAASETNAA